MAGGGIAISAGAVPTTDLLSISSRGTSGDAAGSMRSLSTTREVPLTSKLLACVSTIHQARQVVVWSGMRIVKSRDWCREGVTEYGIKIEGPTSAGGKGGAEEVCILGRLILALMLLADSSWQRSLILRRPAGQLRVYAKQAAGRMMLKW